MASYLRLHAIRSDYKRKSGRFNIGFGLFIYILIPFLVFFKILCTFDIETTLEKSKSRQVRLFDKILKL